MQDTILLVEDEAAIAAFVQKVLEREGFAVEVVEDGQQVLARVSQTLPDLMILDLMLPGVDGLEGRARPAPVPQTGGGPPPPALSADGTQHRLQVRQGNSHTALLVSAGLGWCSRWM